MSIFYALMALCLPGSILAQVVTSGDCPDVHLQENFDMTKFAGRWFQQARFYTPFQTDTECPIVHYIVGANNSVIGVRVGVPTHTGIERNFEEGVFTRHRQKPLKFLFNLSLSPVEGYDSLLVLGTDYENWGVLFRCRIVRDRNVQYAFIVTRAQVPDDSDLASAHAVLLTNKIDTSRLMKIDQKRCPM